MRRRGKRYQKRALRTTNFPGWKSNPTSPPLDPPNEDAWLKMWHLCTDGDIGELTLLFPSIKEYNKIVRHFSKTRRPR